MHSIKTEADGLSTVSQPTSYRTPDSTLFGTRARHLVSGTVFRWSPPQTNVFKAFVMEKYPNYRNCDLGPLLKSLNLDGYENMRTDNGESVYRIIVEKVRRKLSTAEKPMKADGLLDDKRQIEPSPAPPSPAPFFKATRHHQQDQREPSGGAGAPPMRGGGGDAAAEEKRHPTLSDRRGHIERMAETLFFFSEELKEAQEKKDEDEEFLGQVDSMKRVLDKLSQKMENLKLLMPPAEE